jgi:hypothetical protein
MKEQSASPQHDKFRLQSIALSLILLPAIPLYFMANAGYGWAVWLLMAVIAAGMILGIWVS